MDRRQFIKASVVLSAAGFLNPSLANTLKEGLKASDLVYLSPIQSNGRESSCQAEIWFVYDGADIFVCSGTDSWRVKAAQSGLRKTKFWVGDLGQWKDTNGAHKDLPSLYAKASIETDLKEQERVLEMFRDKYSISWLLWGPRFKKGLKSGRRTMIRYRPQT